MGGFWPVAALSYSQCMAREDWDEVEAAADDARDQAEQLLAGASVPEDALASVAYWDAVESGASARKWEAVASARDAGHQWWKIGTAVRMAGEALRQMYQRQTR